MAAPATKSMARKKDTVADDLVVVSVFPLEGLTRGSGTGVGLTRE